MIGWKPGEFITEPGIYPSIPLDLYHGMITEEHSVSHSGLEKLWGKSPAHYWDQCAYNPDREIVEATEPMQLGRAAHHLFMGERGFNKHYIRRPDRIAGEPWQSNRTACKDWLKDQAKLGLTVIKSEQFEQIVGMSKALQREPLIQSGLLSGRVEASMFYRDPETGIWVKSRPDAIPNEVRDYADLKVVADISDEGIQRAIGERGYHRQGATIIEAAHHVTGTPLKFSGPGEEGMSFTLVFVESKRPFCVEIVTLKPEDLRHGMEENRMALRLLRRCLDTGDWPGPSGRMGDARYIGVRSWHRSADEHRMEQIKSMLHIRPTTSIEETQA